MDTVYDISAISDKEGRVNEEERVALGRRLKSLRVGLGLSGPEVAAQTGLNENTVYRLEEGKQKPQNLTLERLARAYGVSVPRLLEQEDIATAYLNERRRSSRTLSAFHRWLDRTAFRWQREKPSQREIRDTLRAVEDFASAGVLVREEPSEEVDRVVYAGGLDADDRRLIEDCSDAIEQLRLFAKAAGEDVRAHDS